MLKKFTKLSTVNKKRAVLIVFVVVGIILTITLFVVGYGSISRYIIGLFGGGGVLYYLKKTIAGFKEVVQENKKSKEYIDEKIKNNDIDDSYDFADGFIKRRRNKNNKKQK